MWWIILTIIVIVGFILFKDMRPRKTEHSNDFDIPPAHPLRLG